MLGYVQRGGSPPPTVCYDQLGSAAARFWRRAIRIMVASRGEGWKAVPLEKVAGKRRTVPLIWWITAAR